MTNITDQQTQSLIDGIATANHCQAGAVIALSGALANQDATAIAEFVRLRERGQALQGYYCCAMARGHGDLALLSAGLMQDFRPFVCEQTHDDLEFAITLMRGVAQSAMLLLDSNLRIWPFAELRAKYSLKVTELAAQIEALAPARRIRTETNAHIDNR